MLEKGLKQRKKAKPEDIAIKKCMKTLRFLEKKIKNCEEKDAAKWIFAEVQMFNALVALRKIQQSEGKDGDKGFDINDINEWLKENIPEKTKIY